MRSPTCIAGAIRGSAAADAAQAIALAHKQYSAGVLRRAMEGTGAWAAVRSCPWLTTLRSAVADSWKIASRGTPDAARVNVSRRTARLRGSLENGHTLPSPSGRRRGQFASEIGAGPRPQHARLLHGVAWTPVWLSATELSLQGEAPTADVVEGMVSYGLAQPEDRPSDAHGDGARRRRLAHTHVRSEWSSVRSRSGLGRCTTSPTRHGDAGSHHE